MSANKDKKAKPERPPVTDKPSDSLGLRLDPGKQIGVTIPKTLAVVLTAKAFSQLFSYSEATDLEVSLLGIVARDKSVLTITEFFLVEQSGAYSHTELEPSAVGEMVEKLMADGRAEDAKKIRCWAHSHPGMDVFWSQTDDTTSHLLCADWLISIEVSDGFRIRCRLDVASPVPFTLDHLPAFCESPVDTAIAEQCKREVKEKIKHVPLFGHTKPKDKKGDKMQQATDQAAEIMEYCDLCGGWHADGECPMQLESSAYQLAHDERAQEQGGPWEDDVWF